MDPVVPSQQNAAPAKKSSSVPRIALVVGLVATAAVVAAVLFLGGDDSGSSSSSDADLNEDVTLETDLYPDGFDESSYTPPAAEVNVGTLTLTAQITPTVASAAGRRLTEENRRLQAVTDFEEINVESLEDTDSNIVDASYDEVDFITIFIYNQADDDVDADWAPATDATGAYICNQVPSAVGELGCAENVMIKVGSTWHMIINLAVGKYSFLASAIDEEARDGDSTVEKELYKGIVRNKEVLVNRRTSILLTLYQVDDFVQVVGNSLPLISEVSLSDQVATPNTDRSNEVTLTITGNDLDSGDSMYVSVDASSTISDDHSWTITTSDGTVIDSDTDGSIDTLGDGFGFEQTWFEVTKDASGAGTATVTWAVGMGGCNAGYDQWRIQFDAYVTDEVQTDPADEDSLRSSAAQITGPITLDLLVDCEAGQLELDVEFNTAPEFIVFTTDSVAVQCEANECVSPYFEGLSIDDAGTDDDPTSSLYDNNGWHEYLLQGFVYDDEGDDSQQTWTVAMPDTSSQTQDACSLFGVWEEDTISGDYARRAEPSDYDAGQIVDGVELDDVPANGNADEKLAGGKVAFYKPTYETVSILDATDRGFNPRTKKSSQFVYIDHFACAPGETCQCQLTNTVEYIETDDNGDAINQDDLFVTQETTATVTYQYQACATTKVVIENGVPRTVCYQQNYRPLLQEIAKVGDAFNAIGATSEIAARFLPFEYDLDSVVHVSFMGETGATPIQEFFLDGVDADGFASEVTETAGGFTVTLYYITDGTGLDTAPFTGAGAFQGVVPLGFTNWRSLDGSETYTNTDDEHQAAVALRLVNGNGEDVARVEVEICNVRANADATLNTIEFDEQCRMVTFTDGSSDAYCESEDTIVNFNGQSEENQGDNVTLAWHTDSEGALEVTCGSSVYIDDTSVKASKVGGKSGDLLFYWAHESDQTVSISTCHDETTIDTILRIYDNDDRNCPYNVVNPGDEATVVDFNDDQECIVSGADGLEANLRASMLQYDFTAIGDDEQSGAYILVEGFGEERVDGAVKVTFTCEGVNAAAVPQGTPMQGGVTSNAGRLADVNFADGGLTVRVMGNTWLDGVNDFSSFTGATTTQEVTGSGYGYDAIVTEEYLAVHAYWPGTDSGDSYVYMDSIGFFAETVPENPIEESSVTFDYGGAEYTCAISEYCDTTAGSGFNGASLAQVNIVQTDSLAYYNTAVSNTALFGGAAERSTASYTAGGDQYLAAVAIEGGVCQTFKVTGSDATGDLLEQDAIDFCVSTLEKVFGFTGSVDDPIACAADEVEDCGTSTDPTNPNGSGKCYPATEINDGVCDDGSINPDKILTCHAGESDRTAGTTVTQGDGVTSTWDDCNECAPGCHWSWLGDSSCSAACNTNECGWDGGDCQHTVSFGGTASYTGEGEYDFTADTYVASPGQGYELAINIGGYDIDFRYYGTAWDANRNSPFSSGSSQLLEPYFNNKVTKFRMIMNGRTHDFNINAGYANQYTLKQMMTGNKRALTNFVESKGWAGVYYGNYWNINAAGHEHIACHEPQFNYDWYGGNNNGLARFGYQMSQEYGCGHPGSVVGIGIREHAHGEWLAAGRIGWGGDPDYAHTAQLWVNGGAGQAGTTTDASSPSGSITFSSANSASLPGMDAGSSFTLAFGIQGHYSTGQSIAVSVAGVTVNLDNQITINARGCTSGNIAASSSHMDANSFKAFTLTVDPEDGTVALSGGNGVNFDMSCPNLASGAYSDSTVAYAHSETRVAVDNAVLTLI
jgi:hypothetical protein